jgi:S-adenosylmethionine:tRNA ribosyltransferase-isomerase
VSALQTFVLPERLEAHEPPEARGLERDEVRMLVTERASGRVRDLRARDLPDVLATVLVATVVVVVGSLAADLGLAWADPRARGAVAEAA